MANFKTSVNALEEVVYNFRNGIKAMLNSDRDIPLDYLKGYWAVKDRMLGLLENEKEKRMRAKSQYINMKTG